MVRGTAVPDFEKIISFAVSDAAYWKMQNRRYRQALPLFSQNIANGVVFVKINIKKYLISLAGMGFF